MNNAIKAAIISLVVLSTLVLLSFGTTALISPGASDIQKQVNAVALIAGTTLVHVIFQTINKESK